jgi:dipeptidyl aminopeptidase/acylaminoacyl peptidase
MMTPNPPEIRVEPRTEKRVHRLALASIAGTVSLVSALAAQPSTLTKAWGELRHEEITWQQDVTESRLITELSTLPVTDFTPAVFEAAGGRRLPYRLLSPVQEEPGRRYPLILALHGSGAVGSDNASQLGPFVRSWARPDIRQKFQAFVLAPQFPSRSAEYSAGATMHSRPTAVLADALELLDTVLTTHAIDDDRVYVVGFSMGGSAAWHALLSRPQTFAAALVLSGVPPPPAAAANIRAVVTVVHGTADTENALAPAERFMGALQLANTQARFRLYRGLDHRIPADVMVGTAWRDWLFAKRSSNLARRKLARP